MDAAASHPFGISEIPGSPSFRNSAVNAIAVVPLLSSNRDGDDASTQSTKSFVDLFSALCRYSNSVGNSVGDGDDFYLIVPNSMLTRPGDWRYNETPLKSFHWQHGCQRMRLFDGRPEYSRLAHDRLMNHAIARDWIDLCPSRRTAAVIGVLNVHDCKDISDVHRAQEELRKWAEKYASPSYEVSAHGKDAERDQPVYRMFVYDSFDEEGQKIDLSQTNMGSHILAFPPTDDAHAQMMDLHLNVVINDLAVAIFRDLESKIRESDKIKSASIPQVASSQKKVLSRILSTNSEKDTDQPSEVAGELNVGRLAGLVSSGNILAEEASPASNEDLNHSTKAAKAEASLNISMNSSSDKPSSSSLPLLLTPLDTYWEQANLTRKDIEDIRKRDIGRREKYAADLALLLGSPLDAYERYLKAAELCKSSSSIDPLWYAASLEGCAAAHIAMAEGGGFDVDEYLENNFQLPKDFFPLVNEPGGDKISNVKQSLPDVVIALCEEALAIVARNSVLSVYHAEILLKMAWYLSDLAERHQRCRWGEGEGCYAGEPGSPPRWERTSMFDLEFDSVKLIENGLRTAREHTSRRISKMCKFLNATTSLGALQSGTRVDVATQAVRICLHGIKPTSFGMAECKPVILHRKAAFFAAIAADATGMDSSPSSIHLWLLTSQLYSRTSGESYGWATLRSACLSTLASKGSSPLCLEAAEHLLSLLCSLKPERHSLIIPSIDNQEEISIDGTGISASNHGSVNGERHVSDEKDEVVETSTKMNSTKVFAKQLRDTITTFAHSSTSFIAQQSKWASDDPLVSLLVPLGESSPLSVFATDLDSAWTNSDLSKCSSVQTKCLNRISLLRRALAVPSQTSSIFPLIYAVDEKPPGPLFISSASTSGVVSQVELVKTDPTFPSGDEANPAMSTFYNPFESKRNAGGLAKARNILEGDERVISVKFGNKLSVPVDVTNAHLIFGESNALQPISTPLVFTAPPNSVDFIVNFPFTIMRRESSSTTEMAGMIDIKGIECDCLGRLEFIQIRLDSPERPNLELVDNLPAPASMYPFVSSQKSTGDDSETGVPVIHALPFQPSLEVRLAESNLPVDKLSVNLNNGAMYTSPPFRLHSCSGALGRGNLEHFEIHVSGVTGINQKIFDISTPSNLETDDDFLKSVLATKISVPIKIRVKSANLSLDGINRHDTENDDCSIIRFQVASGYETSRKLPKNSTLTLKLRYRGSSLPGLHVWRSKEITLDIVTSQGPHVSSISFLQEANLSHMLRQTYSSASASVETLEPETNRDKRSAYCIGDILISLANESNSAYCIGDSTSAYLCDKEVGILISVANESSSAIELSKENGHLGEAARVPIDKLLLRPSVTIKIPMILSRIEVRNREEIFDNIVDEIECSTTMIWKSEGGTSEGNCGRIRIPRRCLEELVRTDSSIVSKLIEPPFSFEILVGDASSSEQTLHIGSGSRGAKVCAKIKVADWVSEEERNTHDLIIELVCFQEGRTSIVSSNRFNWAGKVRNRMKLSSESFEHNARLVFHRPGTYLVSACAKIVSESKNEDNGVGIWCAPSASRIVVSETKDR